LGGRKYGFCFLPFLLAINQGLAVLFHHLYFDLLDIFPSLVSPEGMKPRLYWLRRNWRHAVKDAGHFTAKAREPCITAGIWAKVFNSFLV